VFTSDFDHWNVTVISEIGSALVWVAARDFDHWNNKNICNNLMIRVWVAASDFDHWNLQETMMQETITVWVAARDFDHWNFCFKIIIILRASLSGCSRFRSLKPFFEMKNERINN